MGSLHSIKYNLICVDLAKVIPLFYKTLVVQGQEASRFCLSKREALVDVWISYQFSVLQCLHQAWTQSYARVPASDRLTAASCLRPLPRKRLPEFVRDCVAAAMAVPRQTRGSHEEGHLLRRRDTGLFMLCLFCVLACACSTPGMRLMRR